MRSVSSTKAGFPLLQAQGGRGSGGKRYLINQLPLQANKNNRRAEWAPYLPLSCPAVPRRGGRVPDPRSTRGFGAARDPDWQPQALRLRFSINQIPRDQSQRTLALPPNLKPVRQLPKAGGL